MLERYGWSEKLQREYVIEPGLVPARVIIQQRGLYVVVCAAGEMTASLSGRFMQDAQEGDYLVAGDWVAVAARANEGRATIKQLLPRAGVFRRRAAGPGAPRQQIVAANVDVALLLASLNADLSARRMERYLAAAWEGNADPVIVLTKSDVCDAVEPLRAAIEAVAFGVPVHVISALTGDLTALVIISTVVSRRHFFFVAPDWRYVTGTMIAALGGLCGFVGERR